MKIKDKHRLNLYIDPEIVDKAKSYAANEGYSLSTLVCKALKSYMESGEMIANALNNPEGRKNLEKAVAIVNALSKTKGGDK